ncbi:hypothetical protein SUGI_0757150 [Cryptomeria japonica]|nr:hypothetical protein SUGI_0757150 [Cryptomeria japonica]
MCYVGQVCKLCSFLLVIAVVGVVIFGFVWLGHHEHHHSQSPSIPSSGNTMPLPGTGTGTGGGVGTGTGTGAAPPPLSSTRPFITADSPAVHR